MNAAERAPRRIAVAVGVIMTASLALPARAAAIGRPEPWGSVETQNVVRHPSVGELHFVQQRNTLRLGLEWPLAGARADSDSPLFSDAFLRLAYRGVYDSVYDYTPIFRERDL